MVFCPSLSDLSVADIDIDPPVAVVVDAVALADFVRHAARDAIRHDVCGDVLVDHAARTDDQIVTDGDARQNDRRRADPHVPAHVDGQIVLVGALAQTWQDRVGVRDEHDIRRDHRVVADIDVLVINEGDVRVDVDAVAQMDVPAAPVGIDRGLDSAVPADLGEHPVQELPPLLLLRGEGRVVAGHHVLEFALAGRDRGIEAGVDQTQLLALHVGEVRGVNRRG